MEQATFPKYRGPSRWLSLLGMAALAVALVALAGGWYTAARRPWLTVHPVDIPTAVEEPLKITPAHTATYGVSAAARLVDRMGRPAGYTVVVTRQGYKSPIRLRCTFSADGQTLAAVTVLSQDETEYLGSRITEESFTESFAGRRLPMKLWTTAAPGSPVDGLSGSTVSAQAVVDGVNQAHRFLVDEG